MTPSTARAVPLAILSALAAASAFIAWCFLTVDFSELAGFDAFRYPMLVWNVSGLALLAVITWRGRRAPVHMPSVVLISAGTLAVAGAAGAMRTSHGNAIAVPLLMVFAAPIVVWILAIQAIRLRRALATQDDTAPKPGIVWSPERIHRVRSLVLLTYGVTLAVEVGIQLRGYGADANASPMDGTLAGMFAMLPTLASLIPVLRRQHVPETLVLGIVGALAFLIVHLLLAGWTNVQFGAGILFLAGMVVYGVLLTLHALVGGREPQTPA